MKKISAVSALLAVILFGCYATDFVSYNKETYPPTTNCIVLDDLSKCEYDYTIFGMMQKKARSVATTPQGALEEILEDAKNYGADAITDFTTAVNRIEKPSLLAQNIDVVSAKLVRFSRNISGELIKKK